MPIAGLARRLPEIGRLRAGQLVTMADGRKRPSALAAWRFTASSKASLVAVAIAFGGRVEPWTSPAGDAFQVVTEVDCLPVILPPLGAFSQSMELWAAGGLTRRCDGQLRSTGEPCDCPVDPDERRAEAKAGRACQPVSRLSVLLPDVPGIGVWVLTSRGWAVAAEMGGIAAILEGRMARAQLRLEQREKRAAGKPTSRFVVPVLEVPELRIADLMAGGQAMAQIGSLAGNEASSGTPARVLLSAPTRAVDGADALEPAILCGDVAGGFLEGEVCHLPAGHSGSHRSAAESTWPALSLARPA